MHSCTKTICSVALAVLGSNAAMALPTIAVSPASIATDHLGTVQISVGSLVSSPVTLRVFVDANGNGVIDLPDDTVIWTDVVADNVADWSPNMSSDTNGAVGAVTVDVRPFGPLEFPYTAGNFIWQAEDSSGVSTLPALFSITQTAQTQSVTGTVRETSTSVGVPGSLVLLLPFCEEGDEALRVYSTFADENGAFVIQVPADVTCRNRVVVAAKPGFLTPLTAQPQLVFNGSSTFTAQDPEVTPGTVAVTGRLEYATGPQAGAGIPGVLMVADFADGLNRSNLVVGELD